MLPPTRTSTPAARAISPTRAVTVLLPLEPVMAATGAATTRAKISMSPTTGTPRAAAAATAGSAGDNPGLSTTASAWAKAASSSPPVNTATSGSSARSAASPGGWSRVSATATSYPQPARKRAADRPLAPRPATSTRGPGRPGSGRAFCCVAAII